MWALTKCFSTPFPVSLFKTRGLRVQIFGKGLCVGAFALGGFGAQPPPTVYDLLLYEYPQRFEGGSRGGFLGGMPPNAESSGQNRFYRREIS